jgi:AraC-like DNA-binding protein
MSLPSIGVCAEIADFWHNQFRVRVVRSHDLVYDDALLRSMPSRAGPCPRLIAVLAGTAHVRDGERRIDLRAGECCIAPRSDALLVRNEGRPFLMYSFDCRDDGPLFSVGRAPIYSTRLSAADCASLAWIAESMISGDLDFHSLHSRIVDAWAILRAAGAPIARVEAEELTERVPLRVSKLSGGLDTALRQLDSHPMLVDLESHLATSRREVSRSFRTLETTYGLGILSWREMLRTWRLQAGASLMTHPRATTREVSSVLGYSSPAAMCHAFSMAALPSPGRILRALDSLS